MKRWSTKLDNIKKTKVFLFDEIKPRIMFETNQATSPWENENFCPNKLLVELKKFSTRFRKNMWKRGRKSYFILDWRPTGRHKPDYRLFEQKVQKFSFFCKSNFFGWHFVYRIWLTQKKTKFHAKCNIFFGNRTSQFNIIWKKACENTHWLCKKGESKFLRELGKNILRGWSL